KGLHIFIVIFIFVSTIIGFYWAFIHKSRNHKNKEQQLLGTNSTTAQAHNITINQQEPWNNNDNHVCPTCSQAIHYHQHNRHPPQQFGNQPSQPFGNQPPPPYQQSSQQFFNMPSSSSSNAMTKATVPESQHHTAIQLKNDFPPPPPKNTSFQTNMVVHPPHSR
ncbi:hypothetical protein BDA99DRAFT_523391, partial [Phascolomyces articulosus]